MADILVIEDNDMLRRILGEFLGRAGFAVRTASNGFDALTAMRQQPASLAITDMLMPEMEGTEMIRLLRHEFPSTKIIAISGSRLDGPQDYLQIARQLGAHKIMSKPFQLGELLKVAKQLLQVPDGGIANQAAA